MFDFYDYYMDKLVKLQRVNILKETKQKINRLKEEILIKNTIIITCIEKLNDFEIGYFDILPYDSEIYKF